MKAKNVAVSRILAIAYKKRYTLFSIWSVMGFVLFWEAITSLGFVDTKFLPSPVSIFKEFISLFQDGYVGTPLYMHIFASLVRTFIGFLGAVLLAVPMGLLIGYSPMIAATIAPFFSLLRPIPSIAWIPLVILWFGIGEFSKISLIFLAAFLYICLNTAAGVRSVSIDLIRAASSLGTSPRQLFFHVIFPATMPYIITGIKVGAAISWTVVVAAELVAAQQGLGYMILDAATFFRIPDVYVGIFIVGVIGFILERTISYIELKVVHWSGK